MIVAAAGIAPYLFPPYFGCQANPFRKAGLIGAAAIYCTAVGWHTAGSSPGSRGYLISKQIYD